VYCLKACERETNTPSTFHWGYYDTLYLYLVSGISSHADSLIRSHQLHSTSNLARLTRARSSFSVDSSLVISRHVIHSVLAQNPPVSRIIPTTDEILAITTAFNHNWHRTFSVNWFVLCYRTVVLSCLSCLSLMLVHCGQTAGRRMY